MRTLLGAAGDLKDWMIQKLSLASPLVIEASCGPEIEKPYVAFVKKMAAIEQGKSPRSGFLGVQARLLDSIDFVTANAFLSVEISPGSAKPITLNQSAVKMARQRTGQLSPSLMIHARQQMGQLRGYLEQITARRGQNPRFLIRDRITGDSIDCRIPDDAPHLFDAAMRSIRKRVTVTGLIAYGERSRPTSIKASLIEPIEEFVIPFDQLPKVALTDDGKPVEYVRRLRDG
ncbi:MAG: hypothetical protein IT446_14300 [Phycisphaerales bacterium]|nr:hypothetical protein [Phycisphaerales bacterium]